MPDKVLKLYQEASQIVNDSPRAACALLRLSVEELCHSLGETKSIDKNIANLVAKGLPVDIQKALDVVRVVGNNAVHPGQVSMDTDDADTARTLFSLINIITDRLISQPKKIDEMYKNLPQTVREAIENRKK